MGKKSRERKDVKKFAFRAKQHNNTSQVTRKKGLTNAKKILLGLL